ncbi:MAG: hypothetical protein KAS32_01990 [Candidatus Peribacteraceae bacterium]|nr:hypothetical protein [Candidatus Peribacteraceae bacterium]
MPPVVRINDMFVGTCCCHSKPTCIDIAGLLIVGNAVHVVEGSPQSRVGDMGIGFCGHPTILVTGSPTNFSGGPPKGRIGDTVTGCVTGIMVTGAGTDNSG